MLWFRNTKSKDMLKNDFVTIMPNPHFNKLKKPLFLGLEYFDYMSSQLAEYIEMWHEYQVHGIKPWDVKGVYLIEDISALDMFKTIESDMEKYNRLKSESESNNRAHITS